MTKPLSVITTFAIAAALVPAADPSRIETPTAKAWEILQAGATNRSSAKRVNAIHALRLLPNRARAQKMVEDALSDANPKVRAAGARTLGLMKAASSCPKLEAALDDKVPAVVLAAAHSLVLLGHPEEAYEIDCEVLTGDRKGSDSFVANSKIKKLWR
jgi:HEAT repeat protein